MKKRCLQKVLLMFCSVFILSTTSATTSEVLLMDTTTNESKTTSEDEIVKKVLSYLPKISGYMQTGYAWEDKNAGNFSSFQMKRTRLIIDKDISPMFDMRMQFEVFSGSTDGNIGKKVMTVADAYVNTHFHKSFHVRLGQFTLPLGFENIEQSPSNHETIDYSSINQRMVCRNPVSATHHFDYGRDLGVMAFGGLLENEDKGFDYLTYHLSVTNGYIITLPDNNKSKDLSGRLVIQPIKDLRLTGAYNWGEYERTQIDSNTNESYTQKNLSNNRYFAGAWYANDNGLILRSEYGHMRSREADVKEDAVYVLAAYQVGKFLPMVRWDMYRDRISKTSIANKDAIVCGCTFAPIKNLKLQFAYTHSIYTNKVKDAGVRSGNGNGIQAMAMAYF